MNVVALVLGALACVLAVVSILLVLNVRGKVSRLTSEMVVYVRKSGRELDDLLFFLDRGPFEARENKDGEMVRKIAEERFKDIQKGSSFWKDAHPLEREIRGEFDGRPKKERG